MEFSLVFQTLAGGEGLSAHSERFTSTFNPFMPVAPQNPDYFGDIFISRAVDEKYLKENC